MAHTHKQLDAQFLKLLGRRNGPLFRGKVNAFFIAAFCIALQLDDLRAPRLAEKTTGFAQIRFRLWRIHINMLALVCRIHHVRQADSEAAVSAAKPDGHLVGFWKFEVAVDFAHHVQQELVGGIAPVHAAANFSHGERPKVAPLVIQLAVILLKPRLKLKAQEAVFHFIARCVCDGANTEELV